MSEQMLEGLVRTENVEWKPLVESGVDTSGITVKPLRVDPVTGRAVSFLLRFEEGAKYPYHNHPGTETGCTLLFQVPDEVVIL
jgi:anti-sigma factor ChrR (cupin superfamily)